MTGFFSRLGSLRMTAEERRDFLRPHLKTEYSTRPYFFSRSCRIVRFRERVTRAVQPVWWLAPRPRPVSPSKYSWNQTKNPPPPGGGGVGGGGVFLPPAGRARVRGAP